MRVKLHFEDFPASSNKRKVCFLVDKESCKRVTDLCYLIKEQYYSSNGMVSLYLDGFYFPPQESINIIQENDTLDVRFVYFPNVLLQHGSTASVKKVEQVDNKQQTTKEILGLISIQIKLECFYLLFSTLGERVTI